MAALCGLERAVSGEQLELERRPMLPSPEHLLSVVSKTSTVRDQTERAITTSRCKKDSRLKRAGAGQQRTGKTHIGLALGLAACQQGFRVRYTTARHRW
jgi:hypothetical protein